MKTAISLWLGFLFLTACRQENLPTDYSAFIPVPMELSENCIWKDKELILSEKSAKTVSFRYANCGFEEATNFHIANQGTRVNKGFYDVIYENFNIFERTDKPIKEFITSLPVILRPLGDNCEPKQISDRFWIIDDGLDIEAEIDQMPCGDYGRNFFGPTVFEVRDDIVLNYNLWQPEDGIDRTSITLNKRNPP